MQKNKGKSKAIDLAQTILSLTLMTLTLIGAGCYEKVDGCLDIYASNFNANADNPCEDDCCTYPSISFVITHLMGEEGLRYDTTLYSTGTTDSVSIVGITYFISDIALLGTDGNLTIQDTVQVRNTDDEGLILTDDFMLVDFIKGRSYSPGSFQTAGTYDSLQLRLGLDNTVATVDPASLSSGHNLSLQTDTMWQETEGYALAKILLVSQSNYTDTLEYFIPTVDNSLEITLPLTAKVDFGTNYTISLDVDYQKWLQGIDFAAIGTDKDQVASIIVNNLPNSISITE